MDNKEQNSPQASFHDEMTDPGFQMPAEATKTLNMPVESAVKYQDIPDWEPPKTSKPKKSWRKRIPKSTLINFSALIALFAIIFVLQQIGSRISSTDEETTKDVAVEVKALSGPDITLDVKNGDDEVRVKISEGVKIKNEESKAPESATAVQQKDKIQEAKNKVSAKATQKKKIVKRASTSARRKSKRPIRYYEDSISVADLDNEAARQRYIELNHNISTGLLASDGIKSSPSGNIGNTSLEKPIYPPADEYIPFERTIQERTIKAQ